MTITKLIPARAGRVLLSAAAFAAFCAPAGVGAAPAAFGRAPTGGVNEAYAAYGTTVQLVVPTHHGLEPKLAISYSTSQRNGWVGVGGVLQAASTITRANRGGGVPSMTATDVFLLDGEELLSCTELGGTHCPRVQNYQRIVRDAAADEWQVTSKNGTTMTFRPVLVTPTGGVLRWGVSRVRDLQGNAVNYEYTCGAAGDDCTLSRITYGATEVRFFAETRPDRLTYAGGAGLLSLRTRLRSVVVRHGGDLVRAYALGYAPSPASARSLLVSVQEVGDDATVAATGAITGGTRLPARSFGYTGDPGTTLGAWPAAALAANVNTVLPADVDGDGRVDLVQVLTNAAGPSLQVLRSTGSGWAAGSTSGTLDGTGSTTNWLVGDANADGKADIVRISDVAGTSNYALHLSNGTGYALAGSGSLGVPGVSLRWLAGDVTGDGLTDLTQIRDGGGGALAMTVFASTGAGFAQTWASPAWGLGSGALRWFDADVNADGRMDIVELWDDAGQLASLVFLSDGAGFVPSASRRLGTAPAAKDFLISDVNGDSASDIIHLIDDGGALRAAVYRSNGAQLEPSTTFALSASSAAVAWLSGDVTGDGRGDVVQVIDAGGVLTTANFVAADDTLVGGPSQNLNVPAAGATAFSLLDLDGDGRGDLSHATVETSAGATLAGGWFGGNNARAGIKRVRVEGNAIIFSLFRNGDLPDVPITFTGPGPLGASPSCTAGNNVLVVGIGGDATTLRFQYGNTSVCEIYFAPGVIRSIDPAGVFTTIPGALALSPQIVTNGAQLRIDLCVGEDACSDDSYDSAIIDFGGGALTAAVRAHMRPVGFPDLLGAEFSGYGGSTSIAYVPSPSWSNTYLPLGVVFPTVSQITTSDGKGNATTWPYRYEGANWSRRERRFLGYRHVVKTVDALGTTSQTWFNQRFGSMNQPVVQSVRDAGGNIYRETRSTYAENQVAPYTSLLTDRWDFECNLGATCRRVLSQFAYDQFGNITTSFDWGDFDVTGDERTVARGLFPAAGPYIVGLTAYETIYGGIGIGGPLLGQTLHLYDGATTFTAAPSGGLLTQRRIWDSTTGGYVSERFEHDAAGNVRLEVDRLGSQTTTTYDADGRLPIQTCNALGHCSTTTWDAGRGLPRVVTDANGVTVTTQYDALGRYIVVERPDGSEVTAEYLDWGAPASQRVVQREPDGTPNGLWQETYFDGLGRTTAVVSEGGSSVRTAYDGARKLVVAEQRPTDTGETPQWMTYVYDGLERPLKVTYPDNTIATTVYRNGMTTATDELGRITVSTYDVHRRLTSVTRQLAGEPVVTRFAYNLRDQLRQTTDPLGRVTTIGYDSLGRRLALRDPNLGLVTQTYDLRGAVLSHTDGRGRRSERIYDAIGRPTLEELDGVVAHTWRYDEEGRGSSIGRVTTATFSRGERQISWNQQGHESSQTVCVDGDCQTIASDYDALDRLSRITYPDDEVIEYRYAADGRLSEIPGVVDTIKWNGRDQIQSMAFANGVTQAWSYDPAREWLTQSTVLGPAPAGQLYRANYTRDVGGRIGAIASPTDPLLAMSFGYDGLDRLTTVSGAQTQSYVYDKNGNITAATDRGAYAYADPAHPDAASAVGGAPYSYDAAGNTAVGGGRSFAWDALGRLASVTEPGGTETFDYDDGENRVARGDARFFGPLLERREDGVLVRTIRAAGMLVARRDDEGQAIYHGDVVDSVRLVTGEDGAVVGRYAYRPYGETLSATGTGTDERRFGGHRRDAGGLIYMGARYYDPALLRFVSPDSDVPDPADVRAFNRYAFAYGNPITNSDPSGHAPLLTISPGAVFSPGGLETLSFSSGNFGMDLTFRIDNSIRFTPFDAALATSFATGSFAVGFDSGASFGFTTLPGFSAAAATFEDDDFGKSKGAKPGRGKVSATVNGFVCHTTACIKHFQAIGEIQGAHERTIIHQEAWLEGMRTFSGFTDTALFGLPRWSAYAWFETLGLDPAPLNDIYSGNRYHAGRGVGALAVFAVTLKGPMVEITTMVPKSVPRINFQFFGFKVQGLFKTEFVKVTKQIPASQLLHPVLRNGVAPASTGSSLTADWAQERLGVVKK